MVPARVYVVCLYGHLRMERSDYSWYLDYLRRIADRIVADIEVTHVILCGGRTRQDQELSEAASVEPELRRMLEQRGLTRKVRIILEEASLNTPQNIRNAVQKIRPLERLEKLAIVCDHHRTPVVRVVGMRLIPKRYRWNVVGIQRHDIAPSSNWWLQCMRACLYLIHPTTLNQDLRQSTDWV